MKKKKKVVVYQVFTRLFGNVCFANVKGGSLEENGCGHFSAFSSGVLREFAGLGITHVWYTGVIAHASKTDRSSLGIPADHPAIVKGCAGSPYAIRDYYDVDPDLADVPEDRMKDFLNLVYRTHDAGLKVVLDFVPNHVARCYVSRCKPAGVRDLGEDDDRGCAFSAGNNFYYVPGERFDPCFDLGADGVDPYVEVPAKATGNDVFSSRPGVGDWFETVKLNYGVDYVGGRVCHFDPIPSTWFKMRDILLFWVSKGVDAFRCDMAEMVPVEFWQWAISEVKLHYPTVEFIAEVYNPGEYRNYIRRGGFDYLYNKVGLYDTLRGVVCGSVSARAITGCWQGVDDIVGHMLNFMENHDEQRIASDFFAGGALAGRPALLVCAFLNRGPVMIYFGQELGERGMDCEGYSGLDGRTSIFDYWSPDVLRRQFNGGRYSNRLLSGDEVSLKRYYSRVLCLCNSERAIREGDFYDLMYVNLDNAGFDADRCFAFVRRALTDVVVVVVNFAGEDRDVSVRVPRHLFELYGIEEECSVAGVDLLGGGVEELSFSSVAPLCTCVPAYSGKVLKIRCRRVSGVVGCG